MQADVAPQIPGRLPGCKWEFQECQFDAFCCHRDVCTVFVDDKIVSLACDDPVWDFIRFAKWRSRTVVVDKRVSCGLQIAKYECGYCSVRC